MLYTADMLPDSVPTGSKLLCYHYYAMTSILSYPVLPIVFKK